MKKQLLLSISSLFLLASCGNQQGSGGNTPSPEPTPEPGDPDKNFKVTKEEAKKALSFEGISNLTMDYSYSYVDDYGLSNVGESYKIRKVFDGNKFYIESYIDEFSATSESKYRAYCESHLIEYKEDDYLTLLSTLESNYECLIERDDVKYFYNDYSYTITIEELDNHIFYEYEYMEEDEYYRRDTSSYGKDSTLKNEYLRLCNIDYIDFDSMVFNSETKTYLFSNSSLGGLFYSDERTKISNPTIQNMTVSFINQKLSTRDYLITGTYENRERTISSELKVTNYGGSKVDIPTEYVDRGQLCEEHEDETFVTQFSKEDYGGKICEYCDNVVVSSVHEHDFDEFGICKICGDDHYVDTGIVYTDWFGCPWAVASLFVKPETGKATTVNYHNDNLCGQTQGFTYIKFPDDETLYLTSGTSWGSYLYYGGGAKTIVEFNISGYGKIYAFPSEYTFELQKINEVEQYVMVVSEVYHDFLQCDDD